MQFLTTVALAGLYATSALASSPGRNAFRHLAEMKQRHNTLPTQNTESVVQQPVLQKRQSPYLNDRTRPFAVNGTGIPKANFDVGESYAGLLPISDDPDETRKLYFWFFPSTNPNATEEIAVWFNGGPGCSSLSGLLNENGPFTYEAGTLAPVKNAYSWNNLTNMVWVEQPVGVGYTQGVPNIRNERELAQQFLGFWANFMRTFSLEQRKVYVTGESYAGFYVPYVANAMIEANNTDYYNLAGIAINDPIIGDETNQQAVTILPYVDYYQDSLMTLNATFLARVREANARCGYTDYFNRYLQFPPPKGPFPVLESAYDRPGCDVLDSIYAAVLERNPCFNIYHITEQCPFPYSHLGIINEGDYTPVGAVNYFNRTDVKRAINAPVGVNWQQCSSDNVFGGPTDNETLMDTSLGPAQNGVLANVIRATNNVLIGSGDLDFLLNTNGTLLAIQNMTWGGVQGLTEPPTNDFYVPYHPEYSQGSLGDAGIVGKWVTQRGMTFYTVKLAGHELPGYTKGSGYRVLEKLLGRVPTLSSTMSFTTQNGNFTGHTDLY